MVKYFCKNAHKEIILLFFANDPCGHVERCGLTALSRNKFLQIKSESQKFFTAKINWYTVLISQLFHSPQQHHHSPSPPPPPHTHEDDSSYHDSTRHTTPLEPLSMPPQLANALEHIVAQLDILTQVRDGGWRSFCL